MSRKSESSATETDESDDNHVFVRLDPGDLALESIREACERHDVDAGVIVTGIGTFRNLNSQYVQTDETSGRNEFFELAWAWAVGTVDGAIADDLAVLVAISPVSDDAAGVTENVRERSSQSSERPSGGCTVTRRIPAVRV